MNDKIKDTKINLCDNCKLEIPTCPKAEVIEFGDGKGNDNIISCSEYKPAGKSPNYAEYWSEIDSPEWLLNF